MKTPPFSLAEGTKYLLDGKEVDIDRLDVETGDVWLTRPFTKEKLSYTIKELAGLRMRGELTSPPGQRPPYEPPGKGKASLKELTKEQRKRVQRRLAYATACAPLYPVGPLSSRLSRTIAEVAERIRDKSAPSPHSVYRWMRRFILSNYDTAVFVQDAGAIRQRKPRIPTGVEDLLELKIKDLLGANKAATLNGVMDEALASVAKQLGYLTFIAKDGTEHNPDEFLLLAQQKRELAQQGQ